MLYPQTSETEDIWHGISEISLFIACSVQLNSSISYFETNRANRAMVNNMMSPVFNLPGLRCEL